VAQGFVQDGGSFSVCWKEPPTILLPHCREEFAYVVKQPMGGVLVTIYSGVAANQWFSASDQPTLTSYHYKAIGCRESDVPGEGAFVVLEDIGATPSHLLATPSQTSFQSVAAPAYNSGLLNPVANPADAIGQLLNRNLGGGVSLQYHFTESMRPLGARDGRARSDRHRGVCQRALLGRRAARARARCQADGAELREALRQTPEERCGRR
jgi:hypothetical protein